MDKVYSDYIKVGIHIRIIRNKKRRFVSLRHKSGKHYKQLAYARYLMEVHLNRYLETYEEVDHKDEDCMNDCIENYQVLIKPEHTVKTNKNRIRKKKNEKPSM